MQISRGKIQVTSIKSQTQLQLYFEKNAKRQVTSKKSN